MNRTKIVKIALAAALGAGVALVGAGCSGTERYEDCEVDDQYVDGDMVIRAQTYESDCGYWERSGSYLVHDGLLVGATWHWWSWVTPGQPSYAPAGWKPPHGLKPPLESKATKKRREQREKAKTSTTNKTATTTKNGNTPPKTGSGNQGIPKGNTGSMNKSTTGKSTTRK